MKTYPTKKLGDSLNKIPKLTGIQTKQYLNDGKYPIIDQGQDFIGGHTNDENSVYKGKLPVIIFGDHTRILKYVDFPFALGADGTQILSPKVNFDERYFYYALQSLDIKTRGYARHFKILKEREIPLPPLPEQKKIVKKIEELFSKIDEAQKLRQEAQADAAALIPAALHQIFEKGKKEGWEEKKLGKVSKINPQKSEIASKPDSTVVSFVPMVAVNEYSQSITEIDQRQLGAARKGYTYFKDSDVLFAKITPCMENGKVALANNLLNGIGFGTTEFYVLRAGNDILPEWIYQIVRQKSFRDEAQRRMTGSAGQKRVPKSFLENYSILIPPLPEQKKIVSYLDSLSEKAKKLQELQSQTATDLKALKQSILHKAFSGELIK